MPRSATTGPSSTTPWPACSTATRSLATVACVPLGVSRFSHESAMRPHSRAEAAAVCDTVERWQQTFVSAIGRRMVFAADEYYLMAERPFPAARTYEGFPQHENGLGMARAFEAAFGGDERAALGVRPGFFAAVDGAPATGYRASRSDRVAGRSPTGAPDAPIAILTGEYGARVLGTAGRLPGPRRHPAGAGGQPLLRGQHRRVGTAHRHRPGRGAGRPARGPPLPAARLLPVRGPVPRRPHRRRPAPTRRGGAHRRPVPAPGPRAIGPGADSGAGRARRRGTVLRNGCPSPSESPDDRRRHRRTGHPAGPGRWWSSPADPTSASRRWSTASWAAGPPSSRSGPGSPATARSSTPSGAGHPFTVVDTGGWLSSRRPARRPGQRPGRAGHRRGRRGAAGGGRHRRADRRGPGRRPGAQALGSTGAGGGQQGGLVPAGGRRLGRHGPRPRRAVADQRPARARHRRPARRRGAPAARTPAPSWATDRGDTAAERGRGP